MCFKKVSPSPRPSLAPSIIPGISAIIISLSSSILKTPRFGIIVVNGYGAMSRVSAEGTKLDATAAA